MFYSSYWQVKYFFICIYYRNIKCYGTDFIKDPCIFLYSSILCIQKSQYLIQVNKSISLFAKCQMSVHVSWHFNFA